MNAGSSFFRSIFVVPKKSKSSWFWIQFRDPQSTEVPVLENSRLAARWWSDEDPSVGTPVTFTNFSHPFFMDAYPIGWGAHLEGNMLPRKWEPQEQCLHINLLEMRAVAKALLGFSFPPGATVQVSLDNSTVVSYINREGGTHFLSLWKDTELIFQLFINLQISIWAVYIPGKINVIANLLSRQNQTLPTEWSLNLEIMKHLFHLWGSPPVNWPPDGTPSFQPSCLGFQVSLAGDTLFLSWQNLWAYAFPSDLW